MKFLRSLKSSRTTAELTITAQKANACNPWAAYSVLDWKYPFWINLVKTENCQFKLKFGTEANWNMPNSMMMFTFSVFTLKFLFCEQIWSKESNLSV